MFLQKLEKSHFFRVLELLGKLAIVVAIIVWFVEKEARRQARHNAAWSIIYDADSKSGDGGRRAALQVLNKDNVDMHGIPLSKAYLVESSLKKARFSSADFTSANLQRVNLSGAVLAGAKFKGALFHDPDTEKYLDREKKVLWKSNLSATNLFQSNFENADISYVDFSFADLSRSRLVGVSGLESVFHGSKMVETVTGCSYVCVEESNGDCRDYVKDRCSRFENVDFTEANLQRFESGDADFVESDFSRANLSDARLGEKGNFYQCRFIEANLSSAFMGNSKFVGCDFSFSTLTKSVLIKANLEGANLTGAKLEHSKLNKANLTNALLDGANLNHADLTGARYDKDALRKAKLCQTRLKDGAVSNRDCF